MVSTACGTDSVIVTLAMIWEEFKKAAPELAALGEERFNQSGVILLGTLRKDGFPRITPVEAFIVDGHLYLGMIW